MGEDDFSWLIDALGGGADVGQGGGDAGLIMSGGDTSGIGADPGGAGLINIQNPDGSVSYYDQNGNWVGGAPPQGGGENPGATQGGIDASGGNNPIGAPGGGPPGTLGGLGGGTPAGGTPSPSGTGGNLLNTLGGVPGLLSLLAPLLAPLLGGIYAANQTGKATQQVLGGIQNANTDIKSILGGPSAFAPYAQAGQAALGKASGMGWTPLNYGPLGGTPQAAPLNLGMLGGRRR